MLPPAGSSDVFRLTDATSKAGAWALVIHAFARMIASPTVFLVNVLKARVSVMPPQPVLNVVLAKLPAMSNPITALFQCPTGASGISGAAYKWWHYLFQLGPTATLWKTVKMDACNVTTPS